MPSTETSDRRRIPQLDAGSGDGSETRDKLFRSALKLFAKHLGFFGDHHARYYGSC